MLQDELYHHGIKGMHWGIRRFQNEDGSRTSLGLKHLAATRPSRAGESDSKSTNSKTSKQTSSDKTKTFKQAKSDTKEELFSPEEKELLKETAKTVAKVGAGLALAYGSAKLGSVATSAVTAHGKDIALFALKQTPNIPMATIQGYKDTINMGMAITKGGTTAGKALMKTGGGLIKVSGKIASAALR